QFLRFWTSAILFDFGLPNEVKERLHRSALQRLSGLTKALALFFKYNSFWFECEKDNLPSDLRISANYGKLKLDSIITF
ncbi:hypothetical protein J7I80_21795, partial [Bacillus sp. ISL-41]|uniref:hypothetical protein n=1 Tax=Bacillus sp. ISL-41 TaxID=2819127 RepID=UPI001BEA8BEC